MIVSEILRIEYKWNFLDLIESAKYLKAKPDESEAQKLLEVNNAAQIEMEFRAAE